MTLIEVAMTIAILGVLMAGSITLYDTAQDQRKTRITRERMDIIARALSTYAESASRLPCPSDPASPSNPQDDDAVMGWEYGVTKSMTTSASQRQPQGWCDATTAEGIVPFFTLNIPVETIQDGWGNYFTYAISPIFGQPVDQSTQGSEWVPRLPLQQRGGRFASFAPEKSDYLIPAAYMPHLQRAPSPDVILVDNEINDPVQNLCRSSSWIKNGDNINGPKAKFCCVMQNAGLPASTDIVMYLTSDATATPLTPARGSTHYGAISDVYKSSGFAAPVPLDQRDEAVIPAFVLISHGPNGYGAYLVDGTSNRAPFNVGPTANVSERANADNDAARIYFTGPAYRAAGTRYYDDIVMWRTQFGIMAYNGTSSCALP